MARPATGEIRERRRKDGSIIYSARVRAGGQRHTVKFGTDRDGWTRARVEAELDEILTRIKLGIWKPPVERDQDPASEPTFHDVASGDARGGGPRAADR
jgi:hypothetical protein